MLINSKKKMNSVLDKVAEKFGENVYLLQNNGYYRSKWNILTCNMGILVAEGDTLDEVFYSLMSRLARGYGNNEYFETDLLKFATKNNLI